MARLICTSAHLSKLTLALRRLHGLFELLRRALEHPGLHVEVLLCWDKDLHANRQSARLPR